MKRSILILLILLAPVLIAQYTRPGSTDAQFLKIGISPRGTAMGDAYIAVVEGAEGTYYNAASLAWIKGTDIVFNHNFWFAGINHDFAAAVRSFDDIGTFGVAVTALYTDEMKVKTMRGLQKRVQRGKKAPGKRSGDELPLCNNTFAPLG